MSVHRASALLDLSRSSAQQSVLAFLRDYADEETVNAFAWDHKGRMVLDRTRPLTEEELIDEGIAREALSGARTTERVGTPAFEALDYMTEVIAEIRSNLPVCEEFIVALGEFLRRRGCIVDMQGWQRWIEVQHG